MVSATLAILGGRYGISLGKVILALYLGDAKGVLDVGAKLLDDRFKKKAERSEAQDTIRRIQERVLAEVADSLKGESSREDFEAVTVDAAAFLEDRFSFESLFDHLSDPQRLPASWRRALEGEQEGADTEFGAQRERLLFATARALARVLDDLPGFRPWLYERASREFRERQRLSAEIEVLLGKEARQDWEYEARYRNAICHKLDLVELFIERPGVEEDSREQELSVAYVTLELSSGRGEEVGGTILPADALLSHLDRPEKRILVVGPAGSGKSTLLKWLALEMARSSDFNGRTDSSIHAERTRRHDDGEADWRKRIPFLILFRNHKQGSFPGSGTFHCGATGEEPPTGWAQRVLQSGRGLLLLDGLDELPPPRRKEALEWIRELTQIYPARTILVVSSRPQAVTEGALTGSGFAEFGIRDLSPEGKVEFVRNWHEAVRHRLCDSPERLSTLAEKEEHMLQTLRTNLAVSLLAANPLLCALQCALNRVYSELPKNLFDLCKSAVNMLLWDRDFAIGIRKDGHYPYYEEQPQAIRTQTVRKLAYRVVLEDGFPISREAAISEIAEVLGKEGEAGREVAEDVLEGLEKRSNLLRSCGVNEVEFVHNELRDYLA